MPLYEFQCESCNERFERIQKYSDPPADVCPKCGKGPVKKLPSSPAIQFKGTGWYITDYARKSGDATKSGETKSSTSDSTSATKSTGDTSTANKPAETSTKKD
ncbi:MAG TPA: zinc ribbon domain-containing protein [Gemmatimonadaceae bacterium]|jgi:putative FmdB family regulatory protein|nr:zinc ribbon domain-containing protein [Gemmatimonadaceae bacterium]